VARPGSFSADLDGLQIGPFWLTPGITRGNAVALLFSGFSVVCLLTFMAFVQPYLLTEVLHIPREEQGSLTGALGSMQEVIFILLVSFVGAVSDRVGRRIIYVWGLVLLAAGFAIYPLATNTEQLIAFRIFYAIGMTAATVMMHTCLAEYPQEVTRGKWLGLVGTFNGAGVVLMAFVLAKTPSWYQGMGYDPVQAVRLAYWTFAAYLVFLAMALRIGLAGPGTQIRQSENILKIASQGLAAARGNRRIILAYSMAFASRGDLAIITSFFSLWVVQQGVEMGWSTAEATGRAGMLFGTSQLMGLLWAFPMGILIDRLRRMTGMRIAFGLAAIGYLFLGSLDAPIGAAVLIACVLAGMGESSVLVAGGVMIGQSAPAKYRGAVLGTFGLFGAVGVMILALAGGYLFDAVGPGAQFVMMGIINLIVVAATFLVPGDSPQGDRQAQPSTQVAADSGRLS
jgi:MFS family permease